MDINQEHPKKSFSLIENLAEKYNCLLETDKTQRYLINKNNKLSTIIPKGRIRYSLIYRSFNNIGITLPTIFKEYKKREKVVERSVNCPRCKSVWTTIDKKLLNNNCPVCRLELEIINQTVNKEFPNLQYFETVYDDKKNIMVFKTKKRTCRITVSIYFNPVIIYKVYTPTEQKEFFKLNELINYLNTL